ncbi:MAG TPA: pitrilysin family protein [Thermoanaerobaculales bacterium]|nr:pitrilysin family protein [Thermoanaerobaculales bacterium]HPA81312.1 pitrilysin family protein [Thermoanaerobaculales bacterium]HQL29568.1 pitrilysin family protein [Thermoanaerobaculales bacterium]
MSTPTLRRTLAVLALAALGATAALAQQGAAPRAFETLAYPPLHDITPPQVVRDTLPNGIRLLLVEDHELPRIELKALVHGGRVAEPPGKPGLAELLSEVHRTGGTASMTGDQLDEALDRIGAWVETGVHEAHGEVGGGSLVETVDTVLPMFAELLMAPAFAQDKIDLAKTHLRGVIARRNDDPMGIAQRETLKLVYGAASPYARQYEYADIDRLTRDDLVAFHATYYRPDATILAVWGDFDAADMKGKLARAFAGWKAEGPPPAIAKPDVRPQAPSVNYIEKTDVEQTFILAGQVGLRLDDPDYPAVTLMSDILGGGFASRIFVKVRTEKGLAYTAGGWAVPAYDHRGLFFFFTSTKPGSTAEALATVLDEIRKIREEEVTAEELDRAKQSFLQGYAFEYDSTSKIVNRLATYELYGYPDDFNRRLRDGVEKVTGADILRVARKHLDPDALTILALGRADQFDKPLSTFGPVTTIDITIPEPKEEIAAASAQSLEAGTELLVSAARAAGEEALRGLRDLTSQGSTTVATPMGEMALEGTSVFVLPGRYHSQLSTPMGAVIQVLDGDRGFMAMGGQVQDLPASATAEMRQGLATEAGCALLLKLALEGSIEGQLVGAVTFEGQAASDVVVTLDGAPIHVYLSADGQTVLGAMRRATTEEGPAEVVESFAASTVVSGLRVPFETTQKANGEVKARSRLTSVTVNGGFAEELFRRP